MSLELYPVRHTVPKQEKQNKHLEGGKFCHDIVIDNMRFKGDFFFGDEQKQIEQQERILNRLRTAKVEVVKGNQHDKNDTKRV